MTLLEQIKKEQIEDLQSEIISRGKRIVVLEAKLKMLNDPIDWYTLAVNKVKELYNIDKLYPSTFTVK